MSVSRIYQNSQISEIGCLKDFARKRGIDLVGFTNLAQIEGIPPSLVPGSIEIINRYPGAIVFGVQLGKLGKKASGIEVDLYLEKVALEMLTYLEEKGCSALIIHPEDEFEPINRKGLLSLKMLAKEAGLGWLGRSLLIVSPDYGPIHRLIAVVTEIELQSDRSIPNQCGDCSLCIEKCPNGALTYVSFDDRPRQREDVLNIDKCLGDLGCKLCLEVCPWGKQTSGEVTDDKPLYDTKEEIL
jgi:epoxyqueuosine reductase